MDARTLRILTIAATLGIVSAPALAKPLTDVGHRDTRRVKILECFDANGDGMIDEQERAAARESRHAKILKHFDANGDGVLDTLEKKTARKVRRHRNRGHRQDRQPRAVPGSEA